MRTETANAQESVAAAIKNLETTSLRGGLGERPPPNHDVASCECFLPTLVQG
jgi:hypothetical protein